MDAETVARILKLDDPTIVPTPMALSEGGPKLAISEVNNSGEDVPAAIKVAP